jgi:hypothetical protein
MFQEFDLTGEFGEFVRLECFFVGLEFPVERPVRLRTRRP